MYDDIMSSVRISFHPHRGTRCYLYTYGTIQEIHVKKNWMGQLCPACTVPVLSQVDTSLPFAEDRMKMGSLFT